VMGASVKTNEPVTYYEWNGVEHVRYDATIRILPGGDHPQHPKAHLSVLRYDESYDNVNNIENEENANITSESYYIRRFSDWGD